MEYNAGRLFIIPIVPTSGIELAGARRQVNVCGLTDICASRQEGARRLLATSKSKIV